VLGVNDRPALTLTEAAAATGASRRTLTRALSSDKFPSAYREAGPKGPETGPWRVPVDDLLAAGFRLHQPAPPDPPAAATAVDEAAPQPQPMVDEWRVRAEVAEALAAERARTIDDLRATIERLSTRVLPPVEIVAPYSGEPQRPIPTWLMALVVAGVAVAIVLAVVGLAQ
jgi:hypothetical protein